MSDLATIETDLTTADRAAFDYSQIDEGVRDEVKAAARTIHQLGKAMKSSIIGIGKRLIEIKGMLPHGQFGEWIAAEFDMSERTAERMINVTRKYELKSDIMSFLSDTVLYMLAAPSTPDEARAEVEQAAVEGKKVTVEFTREAIRKAKPEPPKFAPVWQLEAKLKEWLTIQEREAAGPPDIILDVLKASASESETSKLRERLMTWLREDGVEWRFGDLVMAVNNVRDQRRQAQRQAEAKVVYVEPTPKAEPEPTDPIVRDLIEASHRGPKFGQALMSATVEQLEAAFVAYPADGEPIGKLKIGNRRNLLLDASDVAEMTAPAFAQPTPILPPIIARGFPGEWEAGDWRIRQLPDGKFYANCWPKDLLATDRFATMEEALQAAVAGETTRELYSDWPHYNYLCTGEPRDPTFTSARDVAPLWMLREALEIAQATHKRKSSVKALESRIRKLEREEPTIVEPDASDLEQEADDLAVIGVAVEAPTPPPAQDAPTPTSEPTPHTLPDDLVALGFRLIQPMPVAWAIVRGEESGGDVLRPQLPASLGAGNYESEWRIAGDIDLLIDEARLFVELAGEEAAAVAEVNGFAEFEAWLSAAPSEPTLRECLSMLELGKRTLARVRVLEPELDGAVTSAVASMRDLVSRVERKLKR